MVGELNQERWDLLKENLLVKELRTYLALRRDYVLAGLMVNPCERLAAEARVFDHLYHALKPESEE